MKEIFFIIKEKLAYLQQRNFLTSQKNLLQYTKSLFVSIEKFIEIRQKRFYSKQKIYFD